MTESWYLDLRRFKLQQKQFKAGNEIIKEGDIITIDGGSGKVMKGLVPTVQPEISGYFSTIMKWADEFRKLKVRTNAETEADSKTARDFGAEGIGLCRTEHMFFDEDRILSVRQMILSRSNDDRNHALSKLLPYQKEDFKISRGRFSNFLTCQRCFYLDRVMGLDPPGTPGWTLNETTDLLLKKEFDACRANQTPHRIFSRFGLDHVVPFQHEDMDKWRNSLHHGLQIQFKDTNIILHGGIDDIWLDKKNSLVLSFNFL